MSQSNVSVTRSLTSFATSVCYTGSKPGLYTSCQYCSERGCEEIVVPWGYFLQWMQQLDSSFGLTHCNFDDTTALECAESFEHTSECEHFHTCVCDDRCTCDTDCLDGAMMNPCDHCMDNG